MKVDEIKNVIAESMKSYATVTKINTAERPTEKQFTNIIQEAKTKELLEQQQKKQKSKNIIIHGLAENKDLECDEGFVTQLVHDLKVKVNVKHVMRIGANETERSRPIKVCLGNEKEKEAFVGNLTALKNIPRYKKISITEDYTIAERLLIKEMVKKAALKNESEPTNSTTIWKVRGTPKNGLYIKKTLKKKPTSTQQ